MSEYYINRFLKKKKLKPRRLYSIVNSPELSLNNSSKKTSSIVKGKNSSITNDFYCCWINC